MRLSILLFEMLKKVRVLSALQPSFFEGKNFQQLLVQSFSSLYYISRLSSVSIVTRLRSSRPGSISQ